LEVHYNNGLKTTKDFRDGIVRSKRTNEDSSTGAPNVSDGLKRVFGIDLGTTYSAIAYVDEHGKPVIVPNQESERITPSVVLFDGDNIIVGNTAKESAKVEPDRVVSRVKQHMGDPNYSFEYNDQVYSAEDVSSFVLRKVVGDAELALGGEGKITDVVITCPAYFGTEEREATANAGRLAGLNVRAILNEPTAAAIAYGLEQAENQVVLVYDLGGGTFDITMIEIEDRLIRVLCTGGDHRLGGVLWDEAIVVYLAEQFKQQTNLEADPLDDSEVLNDLFLQAERGKKTLSQRDKAPFRVTHAGEGVRVEIDRPKFEEITKHLLDRTIELTYEMLADAKAKFRSEAIAQGKLDEEADEQAEAKVKSFHKIILVGGATRMPQVRNRIVEEFGIEPEIYDPDEAVAKGAALFGLKEALQEEVKEILAETNPRVEGEGGGLDLAAVSEAEMAQALDKIERETGFTLTGPVRELVQTEIVNVLSKSLGVVARNNEGKDVVVYLLPRNGEVPMAHTEDFGTDVANQSGVDIHVLAGERDSPEPTDCKDVGTASLSLPGGLPARSPIRVKFAINRDGRLSVTATDLTGGGTIDVDFETEAVMGAEEVAERSSALRLLNVS
jgi:molecular chaperone DnaK (HSP70)